MRTLSADTPPAVEEMQLAIMARLPAWRKLELIAGLNALLSGLAMGGLRRRRPGATNGELWHHLDEQRLGAAAARQLMSAREVRKIVPREEAYMAADPISTTLAVIVALDRLGIPYYIGGSLASGVHGAYRATADADVVADMQADQADELARLLGDRFYADAAMMRDAVAHRSSFNVLDLHTGFKVDVFIPQDRPFERSRFERRILTPLVASGEESAYMSSAEDMVLAKLEWYRAGNEVSERQWNDILGMLKVRAADLDTGYLHYWARQLGVSDLLERARDQAGLA